MQAVPGDPAEAALVQSTASQQVLERRRADLGIDLPILQQYGNYLRGVTGDPSVVSWATGESVRTAIFDHFDSTMELALSGMVIAIVLGLGLGILSVLGKGFWTEIGRSMAGFSIAIPVMFTGTLLIWIFAITLGWLPATGQNGVQSLLLPATAVGMSTAGAIARAVDAILSDVLDMPFVLAARSRGFPPKRIILRHALPVAIVPILDIVAVQFGYLLAGTIVVETVFARKGLGRLLLSAVLNKDLPVVQSVVAVNAFFYLAFNIVADVLRGVLDPRIRYE